MEGWDYFFLECACGWAWSIVIKPTAQFANLYEPMNLLTVYESTHLQTRFWVDSEQTPFTCGRLMSSSHWVYGWAQQQHEMLSFAENKINCALKTHIENDRVES